MAHNSNNLTHQHDDDVQALYDAICEQAKQVMDPMTWLLFTMTPWDETDGVSVLDAAESGNTTALQTILDGLTADVEQFKAENPDEFSGEGDTIEVTAEPVSV